MHFRMKFLNFKKSQTARLAAWPQQSTYHLSYTGCMASILSQVKAYFVCMNLFTYVCSVLLTFVSSKSTFLCSLINIRVSIITHAHRVKWVFNVRCKAFVLWVSEPGKIGFICKIHLYWWMHYSYTYFQTDKVAIHWAGLVFQVVDFWILNASSYVKLFIGQCGMEPHGYFSAS